MAQRILVTGGTGVLGRKLVVRLKEDGFNVRIASRRRVDDPKADWYPVDLYDGFGLKAALDGVDAVIHLASGARSFNYTIDTAGTRNLIRAAKPIGIQRLIYVSIVGVDRIPFRYYRKKLVAEHFIRQSGLDHLILRATQFHECIDEWFHRAQWGPLLTVPKKFKVQPVSTEAVAMRLSALLREDSVDGIEQIGGPEVLTLGSMAETWLERRGMKGRVVNFPMFGRAAKGFRAGYNTGADVAEDSVGWDAWLQKKYRIGGERTVRRLPEVELAG